MLTKKVKWCAQMEPWCKVLPFLFESEDMQTVNIQHIYDIKHFNCPPWENVLPIECHCIHDIHSNVLIINVTITGDCKHSHDDKTRAVSEFKEQINVRTVWFGFDYSLLSCSLWNIELHDWVE